MSLCPHSPRCDQDVDYKTFTDWVKYQRPTFYSYPPDPDFDVSYSRPHWGYVQPTLAQFKLQVQAQPDCFAEEELAVRRAVCCMPWSCCRLCL